jgi:hypothetical protein
MRPCSVCRSEDTIALEQSFLTRLVSSMGGEPVLRARVCRICRHVDFWIDEPVSDAAAAEADQLDQAATPDSGALVPA